MKTYALDSNTVIYMLQSRESLMGRLNSAMRQGNFFKIPPTVYYEIRRGLLKGGMATRRTVNFERLCNRWGIDNIDKEILIIASQIYDDLRKKSITVGDSDIFIASYCLKYGYTLITNNIRHFINIDGLKIEDWSV